MSGEPSIDPALAKALGFPKSQYTAIEHERRWLCNAVPQQLIRQTLNVTDVYVTGSQLRLREMRPRDGGPALLKLTRKADVDPHTRLLTSIYLPEHEFAILSATLMGTRICKVRHRLHAAPGVLMSIDEFQGSLAGLVLLEAEFESAAQRVAFAPPPFAAREEPTTLRIRAAHSRSTVFRVSVERVLSEQSELRECVAGSLARSTRLRWPRYSTNSCFRP
jgi:CYTH domain-containing protein